MVGFFCFFLSIHVYSCQKSEFTLTLVDERYMYRDCLTHPVKHSKCFVDS